VVDSTINAAWKMGLVLTFEGGDTMQLKPATAIRKFFSTDCCNTGRLYPPVSVPEIKELKDACGPVEYSELGQAAIDHLADDERPGDTIKTQQPPPLVVVSAFSGNLKGGEKR